MVKNTNKNKPIQPTITEKEMELLDNIFIQDQETLFLSHEEYNDTLTSINVIDDSVHFYINNID